MTTLPSLLIAAIRTSPNSFSSYFKTDQIVYIIHKVGQCNINSSWIENATWAQSAVCSFPRRFLSFYVPVLIHNNISVGKADTGMLLCIQSDFLMSNFPPEKKTSIQVQFHTHTKRLCVASSHFKRTVIIFELRPKTLWNERKTKRKHYTRAHRAESMDECKCWNSATAKQLYNYTVLHINTETETKGKTKTKCRKKSIHLFLLCLFSATSWHSLSLFWMRDKKNIWSNNNSIWLAVHSNDVLIWLKSQE